MSSPGITKAAIADAMKELMSQRPFSKISVGDVSEKCGLNRNSFYYHFKDKYDLVNWIFYTDIVGFLDEDGDGVEDDLREKSGWELLGEICEFFYDRKQFYSNALSVTGQNSFTQYFTNILKLLILSRYAPAQEDIEEYEFCSMFLADAMVLAVTRWLNDGAKIPPDIFAGRIKKSLEFIAGQMMN